MKNTIKELCLREGKKSQVKIGDMKESISKYHDMITEEMVTNMLADYEGKPPTDQTFISEFVDSLIKKANAILKKKKVNLSYVHIKVNSDIKIGETPVKKVTKKKKA